MITFDWKQAVKMHRPEVVAFLQANYKKPLTEQEYVDGIKALNLPHTAPGRSRKSYKNLKARFGFFV